MPPFWLGGRRRAERLGTGGPVLGLLDDARYEVAAIQMEPGEVVAMVTDGATEALSPEDEEFGDDRLRDVIASAAGLPAEGVLRRVSAEIRGWAGTVGCTDDLTLMVLKAV